MRAWKLFGRDPSGPAPDAFEEALESGAQRFASVEPETQEHWRLLSAALEGRPQTVRPWTSERFFRVLRPALGIALVAGVLAVGLVLRKQDGGGTVYETSRGQQQTLTLAEGSEVRINHTSALTVARTFGSGPRRVELDGEAFFRVRKTGTPFVVATSVGAVTVLGTEFNVRVRGGKMEVAVVEGSVRVDGGPEDGADGVILGAGEWTTCVARGIPQPASKLPSASYPGWIHGQILFDRTPLTEACRELEDHFDIPLELRVPNADEMKITGALDARNADLALAALARLTGTRFSHDQSGYTLR